MLLVPLHLLCNISFNLLESHHHVLFERVVLELNCLRTGSTCVSLALSVFRASTFVALLAVLVVTSCLSFTRWLEEGTLFAE